MLAAFGVMVEEGRVEGVWGCCVLAAFPYSADTGQVPVCAGHGGRGGEEGVVLEEIPWEALMRTSVCAQWGKPQQGGSSD